jgi:hypothetical protein
MRRASGLRGQSGRRRNPAQGVPERKALSGQHQAADQADRGGADGPSNARRPAPCPWPHRAASPRCRTLSCAACGSGRQRSRRMGRSMACWSRCSTRPRRRCSTSGPRSTRPRPLRRSAAHRPRAVRGSRQAPTPRGEVVAETAAICHGQGGRCSHCLVRQAGGSREREFRRGQKRVPRKDLVSRGQTVSAVCRGGKESVNTSAREALDARYLKVRLSRTAWLVGVCAARNAYTYYLTIFIGQAGPDADKCGESREAVVSLKDLC